MTIDTNHFKERLGEEKTKLEAELKTVGRINPDNPKDWEPVPAENGSEADKNDAADHIESFEENTAILKELETRYNFVVAALARIEAGTYGVCEVGGEEIESERLEANPAARTCKAHIEDESTLA